MSVKQELLLYQTDLGRLDLFLVRLVTLDLPKIIEDYDKEVVDSRGIELNLVNLHEQIKNVYYAYSTTHKRILDNIAETWFDWQRFGGLEEKKIETVLDGIFDIYDTALIYLHNDMCRLDVAVKDLNGDKYFNRCILLHLTDYIRKTHEESLEKKVHMFAGLEHKLFGLNYN
ncbi:hypothetical protein J4436_02145 [Candidatus Woesearchaeota archaeon]|nr:hypothetical protein [Candidatus Woesearchaeota archaeon]